MRRDLLVLVSLEDEDDIRSDDDENKAVEEDDAPLERNRDQVPLEARPLAEWKLFTRG
jgi:hypothetical protein